MCQRFRSYFFPDPFADSRSLLWVGWPHSNVFGSWRPIWPDVCRLSPRLAKPMGSIGAQRPELLDGWPSYFVSPVRPNLVDTGLCVQTKVFQHLSTLWRNWPSSGRFRLRSTQICRCRQKLARSSIRIARSSQVWTSAQRFRDGQYTHLACLALLPRIARADTSAIQRLIDAHLLKLARASVRTAICAGLPPPVPPPLMTPIAGRSERRLASAWTPQPVRQAFAQRVRVACSPLRPTSSPTPLDMPEVREPQWSCRHIELGDDGYSLEIIRRNWNETENMSPCAWMTRTRREEDIVFTSTWATKTAVTTMFGLYLLGVRVEWTFRDITFFLAFAVVRVIANSWCTARRMTRAQWSCLYACTGGGGDDIRHYLSCPRLAIAAWQCDRSPPLGLVLVTSVSLRSRCL